MKRNVPPPDTVLGERYRVIRPIGAGAFGNVLEVEHVHTRHRRAMKLLNEDAAQNPEVVERFLREASAAGRIGDRHIVETFDAGRFPDGAPYLVMELLDGVTLRALLHRDRQLSVGLACELLAQAAEGIHAAHQAGIVHRDLKPENLFVLPGPLLKILDFGVSRFSTGDDVSLTQSNAPMGTPLYMPPEQFQGAKNLGRESDIYSLGVVLYELLCGSPPFVADTFGALAIAVATTTPAPLSQRVHGLNPELEKVVARAMARDRAARFVNAEELAKALAPFRQATDTAPLHRVEAQPVAPAAPDEPTYRPPQKATPMHQSAAAPPTAPMPAAPPAPSKRRWLPVLAGVALLATGAWLVQHPPSQPVVKAPGPILVLPASAKADWRPLLAAEVLHRALSLGQTAPLVPLGDAERLRREEPDWPADALSSNEVALARKVFAAGPVLLVAVNVRDGKPALDVDGYLSKDASKPDLHRSLAITGDDVSDTALALAHELRAVLELPPPPKADDESLSRALPHASAELYAQGTRQLEAMNLAGALDSLERAAKSDPDNPLVLDALAAAYDAAGHDDQALTTAAAAQVVAQTSAPRVLALQIECRLRGLQHNLKGLRLACGSLLSGTSSLEARLLYANGLKRAEQWDDAISLLVATQAADPSNASVLLALAQIAALKLDFARERELGRQLVDAGRARGSASFEAAGLYAVCEGARGTGDLPAAGKACDEALQRYYFVDDLVGQARAHTGLGHVAKDAAGTADAGTAAHDPADEYRSALELARKAGSARDEIASALHLAGLATESGQADPAREQLAAAEKRALAIGSGDLESRTAAQLGVAETQLTHFEAARAAFDRAVTAAERAHLPGVEGFALLNRGRLEWQTGALGSAQDSLARANQLLASAGAKDDRAFAAEYLADVLADRGQLAEARQRLAQAHALVEGADQAWLEADALRYSFEAGEPLDVKAIEALTDRFGPDPRNASGAAMAFALRALAEPAPAPWVDKALTSLETDSGDAATAAWIRLALAEAAQRAGQKARALELIAAAKAEATACRRLELWATLLRARSAGPKEIARVAAYARASGYLALAARAEKQN